MTDIKITATDQHVTLVAPYHPDMPVRARDLGGKFDRATKAWRFDARDETRVRELAREIYGTDGTPAETVTVRVRLGGWWGDQTAWFCGRRIAHRPSRDAAVRLGKGVIIVSGEFPATGGSVKNPRLGDEQHEDIVLEVRDVPAGHADLDHPDVSVVGQQVDVDALLAERERLFARLREIDELLPEPEGTTATTREAARILGVSVRTVQRWAATGRVEARRDDRGRWQVTITQPAQ